VWEIPCGAADGEYDEKINYEFVGNIGEGVNEVGGG
jgi:hypothetical protein